MAILKKEYELSIWNEELSSEGIKTEKKGMIIGAHDMDYLGRATNIKLKREIKGTNTLTFDMPVKYFDSQLGECVKNEFVDDLYNEQKLKLKYDGKWYEFYIKSINEKKEFKSIMKSFTCQDSFIDELSRTGYEILIDEELYNSVDEITPFMEEILEDSIWDYRADFNWGDFTEFKEERFYKIPLSQFGGSIKGYPIKLSVDASALKSKDYLDRTEEEKQNILTLKNIYTDEERQLELGDDLSHQYEIFWDPHRSSNGFNLLNEEPEELTGNGAYIYVPYSDLSFIYGSIYEDPYKSTEEPASYGSYNDEESKNKGFALQPASKDSTDFIQFIFFKENDEVLIDEAGTIANNNCHYLISIEDWNNLLKSQFNRDAAIYWASPTMKEENGITMTSKYSIEHNEDKTIYFTTNAMPNSSTIDDFTWYPVYYEGYLSEINGIEVFAARKISITDRTEFNLKNEYYTTIYKDNWEEYKNLYSEEVPDCGVDFRVQSMEETRIITPTLARNLVTNGTEITTNDGWEALTQNNQTEYNTGSYANLLEINVKSTTQNEVGYQPDGSPIDEEISDYYLELLSPNLDNCYDFAAEGTTVSDYALNFGLTELENGIEKDKIYAIRICTGEWIIEDYTIVYRTTGEPQSKEIEEAENYKKALEAYNDALVNNEINLTKDSVAEDYILLLNSWVSKHDETITEEEKKWSNVKLEDDWKYLAGRIMNVNGENSEYPSPDGDMYKTWISQCVYENKVFIKGYNNSLDKIYIGQGSIDINGNYELSGVNNNGNNYINFKDVFEQIDKNDIKYAGRDDIIKGADSLLKTHYHSKKDGSWTWNEDSGIIEDNAFLLFKAKQNIENPYLGIYTESEPMSISVDNCCISLYAETDINGIKLETKGTNIKDNREYYVENAEYKIYVVGPNNFSESFLNKVGTFDENDFFTPTITDGGTLDFEEGYLLATASPAWKAFSSSSVPLFFREMEQQKNINGEINESRSNLYVLFVNNIYYGIFWLSKDNNGGEE